MIKSASDTVVLTVVSTLLEVIVVIGFADDVFELVATGVVEASTSLHTFPSQRHLLLFVVVVVCVVVLVVVLVTVVVEVDLVVVVFKLEDDMADVASVFCCGVGLDFCCVEINPVTEIRNFISDIQPYFNYVY